MAAPYYITPQALQQFISDALNEDVGPGDHSTLASVPADASNRAQLLVKQHGVLAGVEVATQVFKTFDANLHIEVAMPDGSEVTQGDVPLVVHGSARSILTAERLALNIMQRMSGIATLTAQLKARIAHTNAQLLDTRKTTPNFRMFEKWAVHIGGGLNHRYGLYDMIILKDNHIDYCGGIAQALENTKHYLQQNNLNLKIEIETRTLDEVWQVLDAGGAHRIMLDNMPPQTMKRAVELINGQAETEASGGINQNTIAAVAETGVDFISVGALTHSATSLDLSLKAY